MTPSSSRRSAFEDVWRDPRGVIGGLATIQNVPISHRYLAAAFGFFLAGGAMALVMRVQLAFPNGAVLEARTYNQLFDSLSAPFTDPLRSVPVRGEQGHEQDGRPDQHCDRPEDELQPAVANAAEVVPRSVASCPSRHHPEDAVVVTARR
jgi:hypothetical protein